MGTIETKEFTKELAKEMIAQGGKFCAGHNEPSPKTVEMFSDVNEKLSAVHVALFGIEKDGGIVQDIKEIKDQTKATNGRVNDNDKWKARVEGLISGVGTCMAVIIALVVYIFFSTTGQINSMKESQILMKNNIDLMQSNNSFMQTDIEEIKKTILNASVCQINE